MLTLADSVKFYSLKFINTKKISTSEANIYCSILVLIKNRFIQEKKKSNARRNVSIYSCYFCYQFDNKITRLYMFESKTRTLM